MPLLRQIGFILFIGLKCGYLFIVIIIAFLAHYKKNAKFSYVNAIFVVQITSITLMFIYELFFHQIMIIYYCILGASISQVGCIYDFVQKAGKYQKEDRQKCFKRIFTTFLIIYIFLAIVGFIPEVGAWCTDLRIYPLCMLNLFALQIPIFVIALKLRRNNYYMEEDMIPESEKPIIFNLKGPREKIKHLCSKK